jgi:uncharacterized protein DUF87
MKELEALGAVDFEWACHIDGVWGDPIADVPEIHQRARDELARRIALLTGKSSSPLGLPVVGEAGAGKTHLLSALRQIAYARHAGFVLVDMTDVNDFWATVQLGFLAALRRPGPTGQAQYIEILEHALHNYVGEGSGLVDTEKLGGMSADKLASHTNVVIREILRRFPDAMPYRDAIRALAFYNSSDFELNSIGYNWLQGLGIEPAHRQRFGFAQDQVPASQVLRALAWLFSLKGPVVIALDQLDAMIAEHRAASGPLSENPTLADRQQRSLAIIQGIATGLLALRDTTRHALIVPVCLEASWAILKGKALAAAIDRYDAPLVLHKLDSGEVLAKIVAARTAGAFADWGIAPPYPSWPFATRAFAGLQLTPREVLKRCSQHIAACREAGRVLELSSFTEPPMASTGGSPDPVDSLAPLDRRYAEACAAAEIASLKGEDHESDLDQLLDLVCGMLVTERTLPEGKDALVDRNFERTGKLEPLHTRIRLVHHDQDDREEHFSFRILVHDHPIAFQSRLNAAITASGIDRALAFRKLCILRFTPIPGGPKTAATFAKFTAHGGRVLCPNDDDLRAMRALSTLASSARGEPFERWRRARQPLSQLALFREVTSWLFAGEALVTPPPSAAAPEPRAPARGVNGHPKAAATQPREPSPPARESVREPPRDPEVIPIGARLLPGGGAAELVTLPLEQLKRHTIVLAGAGSGKTVLVRRIVEEAALLSIPSIVLDIANDLATFGDAWPQRPESFDAGDDDKSQRLFASSETIVWTPGLAAGNPLKIDPLPSLAALVDTPDDLATAIDLARVSLAPWALGRTSNKERTGVLQSALAWYARRGLSGLDSFIEVLTDLPPDAAGGYDKADKHARAMADALRAERQINPLLRTGGTPLDPAALFGDTPDGRTRARISVVSLQALPTQDIQQAFVAQLGATLFSWIKAHPTPPGRALRGLLVIDEAKDLVPSTRRTASGDSLIRLANQARKYGLGLIFATQQPKAIDHHVIANCATQFYGRVSSPAALDVVREQLRVRGAHGDDVATLARGRFYVHSEGFAAPVKIQTRLSLSYHPANPLDEAGILERARRIRPN